MSACTRSLSTDLWLERSRLAGMVLAAVSYGVFLLLTLQATAALARTPQQDGQITRLRWMLLAYILVSFVLATIGFAGNTKFAEMVWIDMRDTAGGPTVMILNEMNYWVNMMALTCYYLMEWLMQALLLYRCFVLWNWDRRVIIPMCTLFAAMFAVSILVLSEASGTVFYDLNAELAYLCLQVGLTLLYTVLVVARLLTLRKKAEMVQEDEGEGEGEEEGKREEEEREGVSRYETAAVVVVESAALYAPVGIIFIAAFAARSDVVNLVLFSVSHVQGIAQLLIIIRIVKGKQGVLVF